MFKKFFGKKNDGFFMQIDESAPPKAVAAPEEVVAKAKVDAPKTATAPENPSATPASLVATTSDAEAPTEQKTKSAKTSIKKDKKQNKEKDQAATVQTEVVATAPITPAFTNFATDYLLTPAVAGNRRSPGANMKNFMSMARDVKEMKKGSQGSQQKAKAAKKTEA
jgi:hypothetical protein